MTYSAIKTKIYNDLDLSDEDFITETEFLGYLNEAIDDCEAIIHNLGLEAKYFKNTDTLTLVSGTSDYDPPSDIYASKYIGLYYINGAKKYRIEKRRNQDNILNDMTGADYEYDLFNLTGGVKIRLYPTPAESGAYVQRYYIRNVRKLTTSTASTNTCEIPESINFVFAHAKLRVRQKESNGSPTQAVMDAKQDLLAQKDLMVENLQEMSPDGDNRILPDLSAYWDMELDIGGNY